MNTADQTYFAPMQNLEVYVSDNVTDLTLANALIITVPEEAPTTLRLGINDYEMEIAPGTVIYWYAADESGEVVDFSNLGVVGLYARRRPALFTSEVLVGALRANPTDNPYQQGVTAIGGTAMGFARDGAQVQAFNPQVLDVAYNALGAVRGNSRPLPPLTMDQIQQVQGIQGTLSETSLDTVRELPYNYTENSVQDPITYLEQNAPPDAPDVAPTTTRTTTPSTNAPNTQTLDPNAPPVPPLNPTGNWCDPGQPWGDGRCDSADPALREWFYTMGFIQDGVENGTIPYYSVPNEYKPFLQAVPPGGIPAPDPLGYSPIQFVDAIDCPSSQSVTVVGDFVSPDPNVYLFGANLSGSGSFQTMVYPSGNSFIVSVLCPSIAIQDIYTLVVTDNAGNTYQQSVLLSVSSSPGNTVFFPSTVNCPVANSTFESGSFSATNGATLSGGSVSGASQFFVSYLQLSPTSFQLEIQCAPVITTEVITVTIFDSFGDTYTFNVTLSAQ